MKTIAAFIAFCMISASAAVPASFEARGLGGGGALFCPSINPADDNEFYVGCDMSELFHTADFGQSYDLLHFRQINGGTRSVVRFTEKPGLLYAISHKGEDGVDMVRPVKSRDNGATWTPLPGNPDDYEETYALFVDYNRPERVVLSYYGTIYFSNDSGATFNSAHEAVNSGNGVVLGGAFFKGDTIYLGTSDGLLISTNSGASFASGTGTGILAGEAIFSFAGAASGSATRLFCLTSDAGNIYPGIPGSDYWGFVRSVYSLDASSPGATWTRRMNGIDTTTDFLMFVAMAENDVNTAYLAGSDDRGFPNIMKTTDAGSNWTHVFNALSPTDVPNENIATGWSGQGGDRGWGYGECAFGVAVSPLNANKVIFTDFGFVHATADGGASWQQAYVSPADQHPAGAATPRGQSYHSIGLENTSCWQIMWADSLNLFSAYSDIGAMRSTDAGLSWSFNFTGFNANTMYRIAKTPGGTLYAGTSGIHDMYQSTRLTDAILNANDAQGKVLFSTDKGATWQLSRLFSHPVFWVALSPSNPNLLYASVVHSTSGGIFYSSNIDAGGSSAWSQLPNPPRTEGHPASIVVLKDSSVLCTYSGRRATAFTASSGVFIYKNGWTDVSDPGMLYWTRDIVVDPDDPAENTWYTAVFSGWGGAANGLGGLYRTTNRGANWIKINDLDRVTSVTIAPGNTGEAFLTTETEGLWHCADIRASSPVFTEVSSYPFRQPERVFFNPYHSDEMWVGGFGGGMRVAVPDTGQTVQVRPLKRPAQGLISATAASSAIFIRLSLARSGKVEFSLYDVNGRLVRARETRDLPAGLNAFKLSCKPLPSGRYLLKATINGKVSARVVSQAR